MLLRLFLLFTIIPVVELALLIRIGGLLGLGPTLLLVVGTGAAGAWLARREGLRAWLAVRDELQGGGLPGESLVHALLILAAGVVLITPGVLTDIAGILLLIPPVRGRLLARVRNWLGRQVEGGAIRVVSGPDGAFDRGGGDGTLGREIIVEEGERDGR